MGNPVTWFEVNGPDPEQTAKFYSELLGWHTEWIPESSYALIDTHSGKGINGGLGKNQQGQPPGSIFYAEDPDIEKLLDRAESLGAKTVTPVTEVPDMVTFALFADPFGNVIGLVKGDGTVKVSDGGNPSVDWFEISCSEPQRAWDFYRQLFGWEIKGDEAEGFVHGQVETGGAGARGGIGSSPDGKSHVTVYASVDDLQKYLERAESLGGKVTLQPMGVDEHTSIAAFQDPQGTEFGLYSYTD
ncbi:MAG TPA: VOC family protein [Actinomycetota bacterium]|nr:VOC family protein [Actinomycetota bacterium]